MLVLLTIWGFVLKRRWNETGSVGIFTFSSSIATEWIKGEKASWQAKSNDLSYFKKKQFIALVANLKMPGQPVQRASSRKRRDHARNWCQEAERASWGSPHSYELAFQWSNSPGCWESPGDFSDLYLPLRLLRSSSAFVPSTLYRWVPDSQIQTGVDEIGK